MRESPLADFHVNQTHQKFIQSKMGGKSLCITCVAQVTRHVFAWKRYESENMKYKLKN